MVFDKDKIFFSRGEGNIYDIAFDEFIWAACKGGFVRENGATNFVGERWKIFVGPVVDRKLRVPKSFVFSTMVNQWGLEGWIRPFFSFFFFLRGP